MSQSESPIKLAPDPTSSSARVFRDTGAAPNGNSNGHRRHSQAAIAAASAAADLDDDDVIIVDYIVPPPSAALPSSHREKQQQQKQLWHRNNGTRRSLGFPDHKRANSQPLLNLASLPPPKLLPASLVSSGSSATESSLVDATSTTDSTPPTLQRALPPLHRAEPILKAVPTPPLYRAVPTPPLQNDLPSLQKDLPPLQKDLPPLQKAVSAPSQQMTEPMPPLLKALQAPPLFRVIHLDVPASGSTIDKTIEGLSMPPLKSASLAHKKARLTKKSQRPKPAPPFVRSESSPALECVLPASNRNGSVNNNANEPVGNEVACDYCAEVVNISDSSDKSVILVDSDDTVTGTNQTANDLNHGPIGLKLPCSVSVIKDIITEELSNLPEPINCASKPLVSNGVLSLPISVESNSESLENDEITPADGSDSCFIVEQPDDVVGADNVDGGSVVQLRNSDVEDFSKRSDLNNAAVERVDCQIDQSGMNEINNSVVKGGMSSVVEHREDKNRCSDSENQIATAQPCVQSQIVSESADIVQSENVVEVFNAATSNSAQKQDIVADHLAENPESETATLTEQPDNETCNVDKQTEIDAGNVHEQPDIGPNHLATQSTGNETSNLAEQPAEENWNSTKHADDENQCIRSSPSAKKTCGNTGIIAVQDNNERDEMIFDHPDSQAELASEYTNDAIVSEPANAASDSFIEPVAKNLRSRGHVGNKRAAFNNKARLSQSPLIKRRRLASPSVDNSEDNDAAVWQRAADAVKRPTLSLALTAANQVNRLAAEVRRLDKRCQEQQARLRAATECGTVPATAYSGIAYPPLPQSQPRLGQSDLPQPRLIAVDSLIDSSTLRISWDLNIFDLVGKKTELAGQDDISDEEFGSLERPAGYEIWFSLHQQGQCLSPTDWIRIGCVGPLKPPVVCRLARPVIRGSQPARRQKQQQQQQSEHPLMHFSIRALDSLGRFGTWSNVLSVRC